MKTTTFTEAEFEIVARAIEAVVPGTSEVGPAVYVDQIATAMTVEQVAGIVDAAQEVCDALSRGDSPLSVASFGLIRALAIEGYYSDFAVPGAEHRSAWHAIGFDQAPMAKMAKQDWTHLPIHAMQEETR